MRRKIFTAVVICVFVFVAASFAVSGIDKKKNEEIYKQLGLFSDSLVIVQDEYVDEVKIKDLIYGALKGMLSCLDPYSQFLDPDTYNELKVDTEGRFGGIGIEITIKDGLLTIVTPIEDTPAWEAGIKAGDRIVKINNELTRDITLTDAVKKMRGSPGEEVILTILRESEKKLLDFKIVRGIIKIKDIKEARILENGVGYIRLVEFRENTPKDFGLVLEKLHKEGMNALILDLRNNPGGLLDIAVKVAERFIADGKLIVYTKGRKQSQNLEFFARSGKPVLGLPLAILINEGSASGSEIVAGCFQDYKRAIIVGAKSFGKGFVQTVIPLTDGSALRLTTSRYFTPLGRQIQAKGIMPDIEVINPPAKKENSLLKQAAKAKEVFEQLEDKPVQEASLEAPEYDYKSDAQLIAALDALKAIKIYGQATVAK